MKIAICGSMEFAKKMLEIKQQLESFGHSIIVPNDAEEYASGEKMVETKWDKIEGDVIKNYYEEIKKVDAILVVNKSKNSTENYVGGNALIETAFAHVLDKRIYLLNPIPRMNYSDELEAMKPMILHGDLSRIK